VIRHDDLAPKGGKVCLSGKEPWLADLGEKGVFFPAGKQRRSGWEKKKEKKIETTETEAPALTKAMATARGKKEERKKTPLFALCDERAQGKEPTARRALRKKRTRIRGGGRGEKKSSTTNNRKGGRKVVGDCEGQLMDFQEKGGG